MNTWQHTMVESIMIVYVAKWNIWCVMVSAVDDKQRKEGLLEEYREIMRTKPWENLRA